ncbi:hypothetical protein RAX57_004496 [Vibrio parahaemolyticus]|uniref:hypothetical protein n=1 Tax=Vibrio parahaemolyticus TaxID=670 RepID=UPI00111D4FBB|nr:hypothetical protein [Vibrio parahaemolyticus]EIO4098091.1 hypothetical protein [Vibrio parahaemolyticus]EIY9802854.1 hypothetical protein [Vibrio parahaemolyticus]EJE4731022.1 hypothetical protein [Vibrio parahaemolyticus]ELA7149941.1 hypothetical protein [Vibrio parahaemolyticus]MBE4169228.1 hypothetical protein [Vibrio parahaemolyticus]
MSDNKTKLEKNAATILSIGVLICVGIISFSTLSAKESALLSLLLTVLSVLASWLFSSIHSSSQHAEAINEVKEMHNENLRTYALKAAEKVNNLSEQLNRLSLYLEEELSDSNITSERSVRVVSAIHMIAMLKSVNDTSLSDWQGVIGEEIEEHRKEYEEREKQLLSLVDKVDQLWDSYDGESISVDAVDKRVNQLKREVSNLAANITGSHLNLSRTPKKTTRRKEVVVKCPKCEGQVKFVQRQKQGSIKPITCTSCKSGLISKYESETGSFFVTLSGVKQEKVNCPSCTASISVGVNNDIEKSSTTKCSNCHSKLFLSRDSNDKISIKLHGNNASFEIDDEFLELVRNKLPAQPWEKHIHKKIAKQLSVSNASVSKAIDRLIARGVFKDQIDGALYDIVQSQPSKAANG